MAHQDVAAAPSWPPLSPDGGRHYVPTAPWPRCAHRVCCLETLVQRGASSTDRHSLLTTVAFLFPLTPSPVVQLPSAGTQLLFGEQPLMGTKAGMHLAEKLFLPFHLVHWFSASHLFIPSPFPASLLSPYACTANVYIIPHLHIHLPLPTSRTCSLSV